MARVIQEMIFGTPAAKSVQRKPKAAQEPKEEAAPAGESRSLRDLTEEEKNNILELHKRGDGPAKIARMFNIKPQAISNFLTREKHGL